MQFTFQWITDKSNGVKVRFFLPLLMLFLLLPCMGAAQESELDDVVYKQLKVQRDKLIAEMKKATDAKDNAKYDELNIELGKLDAKIKERTDLVVNSKKEAKRLIDEAKILRRDQKYAQAQSNYQKALTYSEFLDKAIIPDVKMMIAFCQEKQKLYPAAVESYQEVIEVNPGKADAYAGKGRCLAAMGKDSEAVGYFKKALEIDPNDAQAYFYLAASYEGIGMKAEAAANYELAAQKDPQYYKAFYQLGVAQFGLQEYDKAIKALQSAVAIKKDYFNAYGLMAQIQNTVGNYQAALDAAEYAINIKPTYSQGHFEKGIALMKSERYDTAITSFEKCLNDRDWRDQANYYINLIKEKYLKKQ